MIIVFGLSSTHASILNADKTPGQADWVQDSACSEAWYVALTRGARELHIVGHSGALVKRCNLIERPIPFLNMGALYRLVDAGAVVVKGREKEERVCPAADLVKPVLLVRQLLDHVPTTRLAAATAALCGGGGSSPWLQLSPPAARIGVPDVVHVPWGASGEVISQPVAHLTGIAIPCILDVGGAGGAARMFSELCAAWDAMTPRERGGHPLRKAMNAFPAPTPRAPPAWYLQCASLWRALASIERGMAFLHTQLVPSQWAWLQAREAARCRERLQSLIPQHSHPSGSNPSPRWANPRIATFR